MSVLNFFDAFTGNLGLGKYNLNTDNLKAYLSNVQPVVGNTVYNTPADLPTAGGYTAGGLTVANTYVDTAGDSVLSGSNVLFTATSGFGPFQFVVLYDFTAAAKNLICWWDNGAPITLGALGTFAVNFNVGGAIITVTRAP